MNQSARTAKQIGAIVRRARRNVGLTQADLGKRVGLRQATISRLEKGEEETKLGTLLDVLSALGLEITIARRGKTSARNVEDIF
ncbi:MAG TPA: helix-turn-helix domain-containing protein [Hyphomicrobiaceae bacterium]